ncbi:hypothetical protein [Vibrio tapetis]|uniref:Uncharacterized protein n=1 Tax=Vibrio tapetis subsp. tapetis TaxID=1671868 RepID=A0A2N8ZBH5_9VIBR|nr:hypothetical protein [Vibrio tapetis]SON49228.1 conserved protein of unknown function [Vibrio tapetis subsp. tapetis]
MDKELLARRIYAERVSSLMGDCNIDDEQLAELWQNKATPAEAAKALMHEDETFEGPAWLQRYLHRDR